MSIYITQGRYSADALKGMLANPEDRTEQVRGLVERAGGKMLSFYLTLGEYDFLLITENSGEVPLMSALVVAGATGTIADMKTTVAVTGSQARDAFTMGAKSAAQFRAAGH